MRARSTAVLFVATLFAAAGCESEHGGAQPTSTASLPTESDGASSSTTGEPDPSTTNPDPTNPPSTNTTAPEPMTTTTGASTTTGADGSSTGEVQTDPRVHVFALDAVSQTFEHTVTHALSEGPEDIDWSRWAVLYDGGEHRLYFLPEGRADQIYQFAYNVGASQFEFGFKSIEAIDVIDTPAAASTAGFGMAFAGGVYHLYFTSADHGTIYEYGYDPVAVAYSYGHDSTPMGSIDGEPAGTDWSGWGVGGGGGAGGGGVILYAFESNAHDALIRFERTGSDFDYVPGALSIDLEGSGLDTIDEFAVLDDGGTTTLYVVEGG